MRSPQDEEPAPPAVPPPAVPPPAVPPPVVPPAAVGGDDEADGGAEEEESRAVDEADLGFADDEAVDGPWDHGFDDI